MKTKNQMFLIIVLYGVLIVGSLIFIKGMPYEVTRYTDKYLSEARKSTLDEGIFENESPDALVLYQESDPNSVERLAQYKQILTDMKVPADFMEPDETDFRNLSSYRYVMLDVLYLGALDPYYPLLLTYVRGGGNLIFLCPPVTDNSKMDWSPLTGVTSQSKGLVSVRSFYPDTDFMIGGEEGFPYPRGARGAVRAKLSDDCEIYATDKKQDIPLIWRLQPGDGCVVVCNIPDCTKVLRGIYAASVSLLGDVFVWPVINSSTWFLDDFPSPIAGRRKVGDKDQGVQTQYQDFIAYHWWPDMRKLARKHNIRYSGMLIETYEGDTDGTLRRNPELAGFSYYGRMLLNDKGEIGIHGYNHQPLCGPDFKYEYIRNYDTWSSISLMARSLSEVLSFTQLLYPKVDPVVYVPPSNILSEEGRKLVPSIFSDMKAICSTYLDGNDAYSQEYTVSDDGVIEAPRITSGEEVEGSSRFVAFNELNYHYVASHFVHPDDILDVKRTKGKSWDELRDSLDEYMTYIDESAPGIRHLTASGLAGAVQRFHYITPQTEVSRKKVKIHLENYADGASMLVRLSDRQKVKKVKNGTLTKLNYSLYLLSCTAKDVEITFM